VFDDIPSGWVPPSVRARVRRVARISGDRRQAAAASLADRLATGGVPVAAYGTPQISQFIGPRIGCRVFTPFATASISRRPASTHRPLNDRRFRGSHHRAPLGAAWCNRSHRQSRPATMPPGSSSSAVVALKRRAPSSSAPAPAPALEPNAHSKLPSERLANRGASGRLGQRSSAQPAWR
jgi:hypothetical protein